MKEPPKDKARHCHAQDPPTKVSIIVCKHAVSVWKMRRPEKISQVQTENEECPKSKKGPLQCTEIFQHIEGRLAKANGGPQHNDQYTRQPCCYQEKCKVLQEAALLTLC
mmetsp:Transcript_81895/g.162672  ORF Transcript_81895/g.162672 Transcript_81895/m.162672 type:complete len:109 (-) Transcript_81895:170-496(-)